MPTVSGITWRPDHHPGAGSTLATEPAARALGAVAALAMATSLWAIFAAPRARVRIPALTVAVKTLVFGATVVTLAEGHPRQAAAFVAVLALTTAAVRLLSHHPTPLRPNAHTSLQARVRPRFGPRSGVLPRAALRDVWCAARLSAGGRAVPTG
ncbi:DUF2568 domain-containing protein [Yinghuangia aomiensis]|uniref:DUF2568 domain-containing protein n=1 Tax=Yinghuangia aomiensis TaxID=676205 RepID=UPI0031E5A484